jgi:hypothetical protein
VLPAVSTAAMQTFLDHFAGTLAADAHDVFVLDRAGWHESRSLAVPPTSRSHRCRPTHPELNPVARV